MEYASSLKSLIHPLQINFFSILNGGINLIILLSTTFHNSNLRKHSRYKSVLSLSQHTNTHKPAPGSKLRQRPKEHRHYIKVGSIALKSHVLVLHMTSVFCACSAYPSPAPPGQQRDGPFDEEVPHAPLPAADASTWECPALQSGPASGASSSSGLPVLLLDSPLVFPSAAASLQGLLSLPRSHPAVLYRISWIWNVWKSTIYM